MHLRALHASATEVNKLHRFTSLCNAGASVIARGAQASTMLTQAPGPLQQGSAANSRLPLSVCPELQLYECIAMTARQGVMVLLSCSCVPVPLSGFLGLQSKLWEQDAFKSKMELYIAAVSCSHSVCVQQVSRLRRAEWDL